jgi:hypothetical protein
MALRALSLPGSFPTSARLETRLLVRNIRTMSASLPIADMCGALAYVRNVPKTDMSMQKKDRLAAVLPHSI